MVVSGVWDMYFIRGVRILLVSLTRVGRNGAYTVDFTLYLSWKCLHEPAWFLRNDRQICIFRRNDSRPDCVCFLSRPQHSSVAKGTLSFFFFLLFFPFSMVRQRPIQLDQLCRVPRYCPSPIGNVFPSSRPSSYIEAEEKTPMHGNTETAS